MPWQEKGLRRLGKAGAGALAGAGSGALAGAGLLFWAPRQERAQSGIHALSHPSYPLVEAARAGRYAFHQLVSVHALHGGEFPPEISPLHLLKGGALGSASAALTAASKRSCAVKALAGADIVGARGSKATRRKEWLQKKLHTCQVDHRHTGCGQVLMSFGVGCCCLLSFFGGRVSFRVVCVVFCGELRRVGWVCCLLRGIEASQLPGRRVSFGVVCDVVFFFWGNKNWKLTDAA